MAEKHLPIRPGDLKVNAPMADVLGSEVSRSRQWGEGQVEALRSRFGVDDVMRFAAEAVRRQDFEKASALVSELKEATSDAVAYFGQKGYTVRQVGLDYQKAFDSIPADTEAPDYSDAANSATAKAWDAMRTEVGAQAQDKALKKLLDPKPLWSSDDELVSQMEAVWDMNSKELVLGGRLEHLRSSLGIRTLRALEERYNQMDHKGRQEAMPRAFLWANRAYWRTKNTIRHLGDKHPKSRRELQAAGLAYEAALGGRGLAKDEAEEIGVGARGWDVVNPALAVTDRTWTRLKEILQS